MQTPPIPHPSFLQKVLFYFFDEIVEYWKTTETPKEKLFKPTILRNYRPSKPVVMIHPPERDPYADLGYSRRRGRDD